jgi:hypothetical protein
VKPGERFLYFDPLESLGEAAQERWQIPSERRAMVGDALEWRGQSFRGIDWRQ